VDLDEDKQKIAVSFDFTEYKIQNRDELVLYVSFWKSIEDEEMTQENYLGEAKVPLGDCLDLAGDWGIKGEFDLKDFMFEAEEISDRSIKLRAKWTPAE
jgi:hypothetical protein